MRVPLWLSSAVALSIAAAALSACSSSGNVTSSSGAANSPTSSSSTASSARTTSHKLAGTIPLAGNAFWQSFECGGTAAAKAEGSTIQWYSSTSASDNALIQHSVQAAALSQPQGLVLSPAGSVDNTAALQSLQKQKVPVVEANSQQGSPYYQAVLSPVKDPNVTVMAKMIAAATGGKGTVAVLAGEAAVRAINYRWQPMVAELRKIAPSLTVLPVQYDNFDTAKTASIVSAELVAHPDIKAIYDTSGPEGSGVAAAVQSAGKAGKIGVYSFDADPDEVQFVKEGVMTALLAQSPYNMAQTSVKDLVQELRSGWSANSATSSPRVVYTPTRILTKGNVGEASSQPYEYQTTCK